MIHLQAKVPRERLAARHINECTAAPNSAHVPVPDWVEIEEGCENGYLLVHVYLREGPFVHTWHPSVEEAKEEARIQFSVWEDEWVTVAPATQPE